jgi:hypothetical protein
MELSFLDCSSFQLVLVMPPHLLRCVLLEYTAASPAVLSPLQVVRWIFALKFGQQGDSLVSREEERDPLSIPSEGKSQLEKTLAQRSRIRHAQQRTEITKSLATGSDHGEHPRRQ